MKYLWNKIWSRMNHHLIETLFKITSIDTRLIYKAFYCYISTKDNLFWKILTTKIYCQVSKTTNRSKRTIRIIYIRHLYFQLNDSWLWFSTVVDITIFANLYSNLRNKKYFQFISISNETYSCLDLSDKILSINWKNVSSSVVVKYFKD